MRQRRASKAEQELLHENHSKQGFKRSTGDASLQLPVLLTLMQHSEAQRVEKRKAQVSTVSRVDASSSAWEL